MARFDAILFDFDGVLADTEPLHYACWRDVLAPHGIALDWETYLRLGLGIADREMIAAFCALRTPPAPFDELWAEYPAKGVRYRALALERNVVDGPVRGLIASLHGEGYRMAVVSSSGRADVEPLLERGGVRGFFGAVVCREDVQRYKPDPEPYRLAARLLEVGHPLVVEDSAAGEAAGRAAGFAVLRIGACADLAPALRARLA